MGRKIVLCHDGEGSGQILEEVLAHDEAQLQERLKENPDLLPVEEYGFTVPLMVVGRETVLPSGSVDLIALTRNGDILLVEFKTGPQNPDFRHVVAQLLDYGSHLWGMTYEVFEEAVAKGYFASARCPTDSPVKGKSSLEAAGRAVWTDLAEEDFLQFRESLSRNLTDGRVQYLAVAQRFTDPMLRTVEYLNATLQGSRFYAVELVRFAGGPVMAYEARTVLMPRKSYTKSGSGTIDRQKFLESVTNEDYRTALRDFLEAAEGLELRFGWGSQGMSIRIPVPKKPDGLSVAWLYPEKAIGWLGTLDVSLGFDRETAKKYAMESLPDLDDYATRISNIPPANKISTARLSAYRFTPEAFIQYRDEMVEAIRGLLGAISKE